MSFVSSFQYLCVVYEGKDGTRSRTFAATPIAAAYALDIADTGSRKGTPVEIHIVARSPLHGWTTYVSVLGEEGKTCRSFFFVAPDGEELSVSALSRMFNRLAERVPVAFAAERGNSTRLLSLALLSSGRIQIVES